MLKKKSMSAFCLEKKISEEKKDSHHSKVSGTVQLKMHGLAIQSINYLVAVLVTKINASGPINETLEHKHTSDKKS